MNCLAACLLFQLNVIAEKLQFLDWNVLEENWLLKWFFSYFKNFSLQIACYLCDYAKD